MFWYYYNWSFLSYGFIGNYLSRCTNFSICKILYIWATFNNIWLYTHIGCWAMIEIWHIVNGSFHLAFKRFFLRIVNLFLYLPHFFFCQISFSFFVRRIRCQFLHQIKMFSPFLFKKNFYKFRNRKGVLNEKLFSLFLYFTFEMVVNYHSAIICFLDLVTDQNTWYFDSFSNKRIM